jgi:hypothetical protein
MMQLEPIGLLRQQLPFDDNDLMANREGVLSSSQRARLATTAHQPSNAEPVSAILSLIVALVFLAWIARPATPPLDWLTVSGALCLIVSGFWTFGVFLYRLRFPHEEHIDESREVAMCEGLITRPTATTTRDQYLITVGEEAFHIDTSLVWAFTNLPQVCRVYYLPRSRRIISVEVIEGSMYPWN